MEYGHSRVGDAGRAGAEREGGRVTAGTHAGHAATLRDYLHVVSHSPTLAKRVTGAEEEEGYGYGYGYGDGHGTRAYEPQASTERIGARA